MGSRKALGWTILASQIIPILPFDANISKTVRRSVTCQLELNISSTGVTFMSEVKSEYLNL